MAVNKNFVVKNGLEVGTDLILANADTGRVGVGTTAPNFELEVNGGIGATTITISGFSTFTEGIQVGTSGSIFYVDDTSNQVGVGTSAPAYLLDVRTSVSTGQTGLYVAGDVRITGDIDFGDSRQSDIYVSGLSTFFGRSRFDDYVSILDGLQVQGFGVTTTTLDVTGVSTFTGAADFNGDVDIDGHTELDNLNVSGVSTFVGFSTFNDYVAIQDGLEVLGYGSTTTTLNVTGVSTFVGFSTFNDYVFIQDGLNVTGVTSVGAAITMYPSSGIISATAYYGDGSNLSGIATELTATIGISSEGTFVGSGVTQVNFATTTGTNIQSVDVDVTSGIATVTINPGVSLGLAIALGG